MSWFLYNNTKVSLKMTTPRSSTHLPGCRAQRPRRPQAWRLAKFCLLTQVFLSKYVMVQGRIYFAETSLKASYFKGVMRLSHVCNVQYSSCVGNCHAYSSSVQVIMTYVKLRQTGVRNIEWQFVSHGTCKVAFIVPNQAVALWIYVIYLNVRRMCSVKVVGFAL